ncbi:hypothetical protein HMPREF3036_00595 [Sutterella sp. KLE1602]|nr:hypothetical protein HMPREF3036_00595 [Sutterella sp. KLE1602]
MLADGFEDLTHTLASICAFPVVSSLLLIGFDADLRFCIVNRREKVLDLVFFSRCEKIHVASSDMPVMKGVTRLDAPALDANDVELGFVEGYVDSALVIAVPVNAETVAHRLVLPRAQDEKASLADSWEVFLALDFDRLKIFIFEFTHRFFLFSFEIPREMIDGVSPDKPSTNSRRN